MARAEVGHTRLANDLLDQLADLVIELETDGRIAYVNQAVERLFGVEPDLIEGRSFIELVASEDRERAIAAFRKVVETGEELTVRLQVPRRDGIGLAIEASFRSFRRADDRRAITAVGRDVTHHESIGRVDRLRESHSRALIDSGLHATAITRADGSIQFRNRRFKAIFGAIERVAELIPFVRFGQRKALEDSWFESTRETGSNSGAIDLELPSEESGPRWISLRWNGFQTESGERLFAVQAGDISRRKQIELAFAQLARGVDLEDGAALENLIRALASALELDRLVLARVDPNEADRAITIAGWQDGRALAPGEDSLAGLPEVIAARGELCLHPAGVTHLMPEVAARRDPGFVSFAGIGLLAGGAAEADRRVLGLLAGYARRPLQDPERLRALLTSAAEPLARALDARTVRETESTHRARLAALLRHGGDLVIELDEDGRIAMLSPSFETLLGHRASAWLGEPLDALRPTGARRIGAGQHVAAWSGSALDRALADARTLEAR
ncbi:PAS domain S-box protein, partial [Myxococcota bacterium]|nr:PAS domain S-box protein [Myxococcota bacterium]